MTSSSQPPRKLLDQLRDCLRVQHYSTRTEQSYVEWARRYILFHQKRHPKDMGADEVRAYLTHLAVDKNITASTQNVALSALLFLYRDVLKIDLPAIDHIEYARHSRRVPVVFTRAEVKAILSKLTGTPHLVAGLLYGAGLRLNECLHLRVKDIDFEYCQITVRDGKGEKDRVTMLPQSAMEPLRRH
jgi:integrase